MTSTSDPQPKTAVSPGAPAGLGSRSPVVQLTVKLGAFAVFSLAGAVLSFAVLPVTWCWGGSLSTRRRRCQRVVGRAFRWFHRGLRSGGMVDYLPELTSAGLQQPVLAVANHPTLLDVTAILSAHPEMCCVVRARTFLNPGFFLLQLCCGHVLARGGFAGGIAVLEDIERRLLAGHSVLVFLEGTRSPIGGLHPFRPGSIAMALRSGTPIQPLLVDVSEPMLNPHLSSRVVPIGVKMKVEVLPLLRQEGEGANTSVSARRLTEQLGTMYRKHLGITAAPND